MTTFRFNFSGSESDPTTTLESVSSDGKYCELCRFEPVKLHDNIKEKITWLKSEQVFPDKQITDLDDLITHANMLTCGDFEIGHVIAQDAISKIEEQGFKTAVSLAENGHSDLIAGKYEGGLKIWECTTDLLEYLIEHEIQFDNKNVLDLGCGAGILGIYAFLKSAQVTFQDYNKEVLEHVTIPNVLLNIENEDKRSEEIKRCQFYSGDWASYTTKTDDTFDIILTSETIYNESNYDKLISLFTKKLNKNGVIYLAAKTYYFGVGGSTREFEKVVERTGIFNIECCWKSSGGIQREILKITKL